MLWIRDIFARIRIRGIRTTDLRIRMLDPDPEGPKHTQHWLKHTKVLAAARLCTLSLSNGQFWGSRFCKLYSCVMCAGTPDGLHCAAEGILAGRRWVSSQGDPWGFHTDTLRHVERTRFVSFSSQRVGYWMIYRVPSFLVVVWFGSTPTPSIPLSPS